MNKKNSIIVLSILLIGIAALFVLWQTQNRGDASNSSPVVIPILQAMPITTPITTPTATPTVEPQPTAPPLITPQPQPTAPPLNDSDADISSRLHQLKDGAELLAFVTDEEIVRKMVRAVFGLSEGRIVKEYRPLTSPKGQFSTIKIGQQTENTQQELYRISRDNYSRYANYISLFASVNSAELITLYRFYLPTLESAYQELGIDKGNFHNTLITAIDVLLNTPESQDAILLVQPSVMYKFSDPELEKLPSAHKLMLRMGQENREALKLELSLTKERLIQIQQ